MLVHVAAQLQWQTCLRQPSRQYNLWCSSIKPVSVTAAIIHLPVFPNSNSPRSDWTRKQTLTVIYPKLIAYMADGEMLRLVVLLQISLAF